MLNFAGRLSMWQILVFLIMGDLCNGYLFTSNEDLHRVFFVERTIVKVLKEYEVDLGYTIPSIREYVSEVEDMYRGECPPNGKCNEIELFENIAGNPLHNYNLIKRTTVKWRDVKNDINKTDKKEVLEKIKQIRMSYGEMPKKEDLDGIAQTIIQMQKVYELDVQDLMAGKINVVDTAAKLDAKDALRIGRSALKNSQHRIAVAWLEQAVVQAEKGNISLAKKNAMKKALNEAVMNLAGEAVNQGPKKRKEYTLGVVPPKPKTSEDWGNWLNHYDQENYEALCRGESLLPPKYAKLLTCYYSTRDDPYFTIHPVAVEVHHLDPHPVLQFYNIISKKDSDYIVKIARPDMDEVDQYIKQDNQVVMNPPIEDGEHYTVDKVSAMTNWLTGLESSALFDKHGDAKQWEYEFLQVRRYWVGGHFQIHHDAKSYRESGKAVMDPEKRYNTGDRMSTFMRYLTPVRLGGFTAFPRLGIATRPEPGSGVFWHNIRLSGETDMMMIHAACPVILGSKYYANKWIHEVPNIFHRPCLKNQNVPQW